MPRFRPMFSCLLHPLTHRNRPPSAGRSVPAVVLGILALLAGGAPGASAQIFSQASLNPDAISPNGDGIREFTTIQYTVAVDSADVRILLASAGGGAVVDTLQFFTRQGLGVHSLAFDGTARSGSVPDGDYEVRVVGVGALGEGTQTAALPLLIDRVAPQIQSWDLVPPAGPGLQNGEAITLQACFDADPDTVRVDLSAVDSGFDPAALTETPLTVPCLRYDYTITAGNTVPDGDNLAAVLTAIDRAGNRSTAILPLCISNQPPSVVSSTLLNASPYLQNGDEIQAEIEFQVPDGLTPGADFSNLDSEFDPAGVQVTSLGGQRYEIRYQISDANTRPDGDYLLHLFGEDSGCGVATDTTLTVTLDNAGVNVTLIGGLSINRPAFSPIGNGVPSVNIGFSVLEDSVKVAVVALNAVLKDRSAQNIIIQGFRVYNRGTYTVPWDGSGGISLPDSLLEEQTLTIQVRGISSDGDRTRNLEAPLEVDNIAPILSVYPPPDSLELRNGEVAVLPVTYDRPGYSLFANFSNVDSGFDPTQEVVTDLGGGKYRIAYPVGITNTRLDGINYQVPLTAVDLAGNNRTAEVVRACLNNTPPRLISARLLGDQGPFNNGSQIVLETTWQSEAQQSNLVVTADFSALDDKYDPKTHAPTVIPRGGGVYEIDYTVSTGNSIATGSQLPIYAVASDDPSEGCGLTREIALRVDLDNQAAAAPTLTASAATVQGTTVTLIGNAPDAVQVQILRSGTAVDTFAVGSDNTFSGEAVLLPGQNRFAAKSIDVAGNISPPSKTVEVFSVQGTTVTVPPRFAPGDEIFVAVLNPTSLVAIRIFNLDGVEIRRLEDTGAAAIHRITWDGRDRTGNLVSSGPYLAVIEVQDTSGAVRERVRKAFVFTRRGPNNG